MKDLIKRAEEAQTDEEVLALWDEFAAGVEEFRKAFVQQAFARKLGDGRTFFLGEMFIAQPYWGDVTEDHEAIGEDLNPLDFLTMEDYHGWAYGKWATSAYDCR